MFMLLEDFRCEGHDRQNCHIRGTDLLKISAASPAPDRTSRESSWHGSFVAGGVIQPATVVFSGGTFA